MANQGAGLLFIGVEILAKLARRSCSILWVKPLPTFVKVVEGCVIFNFSIDRKVHYSLEIQRKTILNNASANCFHLATPERALTRRRAHNASPPYAHCARTPMHRRTQRSMRHAGSATVGGVRERLDGAKWQFPTRRRANHRTPLGHRSAARCRTLLPTPCVHRRRG
jgi:hypothetical protein